MAENPLRKQVVLSIFSILALLCLALVRPAGAQAGIENWIQWLLNPELSTAKRIQAARALGRSDDPRAIEALVRCLDKSGEELRDTAIEILQKGKGAETLAKRALDEALGIEQRVLAVRGLRVMRNPIGFPALKQLLRSPIDQLRLEAAWALSMAGASAAEPELIRALDDPNKDVRYFVADALGRANSPTAKAALENRKKMEKDPAVLDALRQGTR